jgi:hypothetical protein
MYFFKAKHIKVQITLMFNRYSRASYSSCCFLSKPLFSTGLGTNIHIYILSIYYTRSGDPHHIYSCTNIHENYSNILKLKSEYSNIFRYKNFANRISEYICIYENSELNTRIYSLSQKSIFIFEYWIFGEQYSNIRNWRTLVICV